MFFLVFFRRKLHFLFTVICNPFSFKNSFFFLHDKEKLKVISLFYLYKPSKNAQFFFTFYFKKKHTYYTQINFSCQIFNVESGYHYYAAFTVKRRKKCQKLLITGMRRSKRGLAVRPSTGRIDRGLLGRRGLKVVVQLFANT